MVDEGVQAREHSEPVILREEFQRKDLYCADLRGRFWDQVHRRTKKFRPCHYPNSSHWTVLSETFIEGTGRTEPNAIDWIRGSYSVEVRLSNGEENDFDEDDEDYSEVTVKITMSLDFTAREGREEFVDWTIDTRTSQIGKVAAYPGIHRGAIKVTSQAEYYKLIWHTPFFSPYVKIETPYRKKDIQARLGLISMISTPRRECLVEAGINEVVHLGTGSLTACVLQEVLKNVARLLVFGPRYEDMKYSTIAKYEEDTYPIRHEKSLEFFKSKAFPEAAAFFSRAYCQAGVTEGYNVQIPVRRCQMTVQTIESIFEHYRIVQEPHWIKTSQDDWVDDLREDALALKTVGDWREFENKWATIVSYACGLNLHAGPWAGDDWTSYIAPE